MGSTFGQLFRVTTFGESHGGAVGVVVDGCPPRLELSEKDIQPDLDRRGFRPDVQGDQLSVSCGGVGRSRCDNTVFMGSGVPLFKW